jgi:hypothetical protein
VCGGGLHLSNESLNANSGFTNRKLWHFKNYNLALGMFLAIANAAKSIQNCQILPKKNFEIPPKIEALVIFKEKAFYV